MPVYPRRTHWHYPRQRRRQCPFAIAAIPNKSGQRRRVHGFRNIMDQLARDTGQPLWAAPLPLPLLYIEVAMSCLPDAKFVHVLRSGEENIPLLYSEAKRNRFAAGSQPAMELCIDQWLTATRISSSYANRPGHLLIRHDQLTHHPEDTVNRVCRFAGLSPVDAAEEPVIEERTMKRRDGHR